MKMDTLEDFYIEELKDLYDAEKQLLKALPRMAKAASHEELKSALEEHAQQTEEQMNRLEKLLEKHGQNGRGRKCRAMIGLIEEGQEMIKEKPIADILNVSLITTAQKVEHYEIAGYGCMTTYAKLLGLDDEAKILHQTLAEEKETDTRLSRLAKTMINPRAKTQQDERSNGGQSKGARRSSNGHSRSSSRSSSSKAQGRQTDKESVPPGKSKATKDLAEIRAWAEARGGKPSHVCGTGNEKDPGLLRIDFPGYSGENSLGEISWEEWYQKFQENNLTFLYQDRTKDGRESRFFKLVCLPEPKKK